MNGSRGGDFGGGGFGGGVRMGGNFTTLGRWVVIGYAISFVLGLVCTHWLPPPLSEGVLNAILWPLGAERFAPWQLFTHVLVNFPDSQYIVNFLLDVLIFWLFAWQVELGGGRNRFLFLIFGVPILAGVIGLPFTQFSVFAGPFVGFTVMLDVLIMAFYMMNRHAMASFFFLVPMKLVHLIYLSIGLRVLFFLARANPNLQYQLIAMGLTYLIFRYGIPFDREELEVWRLTRQVREKGRKSVPFEVIEGGRVKDDWLH